MNLIDHWIMPIAQNVIATLIILGCSRFIAAKRASIQKVIGVTSTTGKRIMPTAVRIVGDFVVILFLVSQLRWVVSDPEPLTRGEALLIAFWLWWLLWYVMRYIVEPYAEWAKAGRDEPK